MTIMTIMTNIGRALEKKHLSIYDMKHCAYAQNIRRSGGQKCRKDAARKRTRGRNNESVAMLGSQKWQ